MVIYETVFFMDKKLSSASFETGLGNIVRAKRGGTSENELSWRTGLRNMFFSYMFQSLHTS